MSTLRVDTIQDRVGTGQPDIDGVAKAWVNFNGTGTVAIRASFNVSSITDNGTGDYTVNFTNAMTDANYCVLSSYELNSSLGAPLARTSAIKNASISTTSVGVQTGYYTTSNAFEDQPSMHIAVFR